MKTFSLVSQLVIPVFFLFAVLYGMLRKVRVYDSFIAGAKSGIDVVIRIFPYLLAIFVAVKSFQASGAFDAVKTLFQGVLGRFGVPPEAITIAIVKPLSGSASTAVFTDIVKTTGAGSIASLTAAVIMGSAETTFYVLAVYLGAVNIRKTRYLVPVCLIGDIIGIILSIVVVRYFFTRGFF